MMHRLPSRIGLLLLLALPLPLGAAGGEEADLLARATHQIRYADGALETRDRDRYLGVARDLIRPLLTDANAGCGTLWVAAEIELRAGLPGPADSYLDRAEAARCAPARTLQLRASYFELGRDGGVLGEGARLVEAEAAWVSAADLLSKSSRPAPGQVALCLARAAGLALLQGEYPAARAHAKRGLQAKPDAGRRQELALLALRAGARTLGEGQAAEELSLLIGGEAMAAIVPLRVEELRTRLDDQSLPPAPHDLASFGFYAIVTDDSFEKHAQAARYLHEAVSLHPTLPDAWYLLGRAFQETGKIEQAIEAYRTQILKHPGTQPTRLATNALAYRVALNPTSPEEVREVLSLLDGELAKTPDEAAMHETRARLLVAKGDRRAACAAARKAADLAADDLETRDEALRLLDEQDCGG